MFLLIKKPSHSCGILLIVIAILIMLNSVYLGDNMIDFNSFLVALFHICSVGPTLARFVEAENLH